MSAFTEDWYPEGLARLASLARSVSTTGLYIEIGVWEGRSAIVLARAISPNRLQAVDTWKGNEDEAEDHPSVLAARSRDVYGRFLRNVLAEGLSGMIVPHSMDWYTYARSLTPDTHIAFLHLDASHDYRSVVRCILAYLPYMAPGSIMCGDDFENASAQRADLHGGVERAVREVFTDRVRHEGNLWWVQF